MRSAFVAPRDLVFAAMTQPEHVRQWWRVAFAQDDRLRDRPGSGVGNGAPETPDGMEFAFSACIGGRPTPVPFTDR
ncbi:MAG: SRPBCC domain-containing protein [Caldilineaceae bacterium]|nr:SRPBCC domain-containing protein [Caldilineaceae bacterium]